MRRRVRNNKINKILKESLSVVYTLSGKPIRAVDLYSFSARFEYFDSYRMLFNFLEKQGETIERMKVVDIGVGKGWSSYLLSRFVREVRAFELEETNNEHLGLNQQRRWAKSFWDVFQKRADNIQYSFFDGYHTGVTDGWADLVEVQAVIEHIDRNAVDNKMRKVWLSELNRVLKTGGYLHISWCPRKWSFAEHFSGLLGYSHHKKLFTKKELFQLLNEAGFEVVKYEITHPYLDFFPGILADVWNILYLILFGWLHKIWQFTPWRAFMHHFRVIARKK